MKSLEIKSRPAAAPQYLGQAGKPRRVALLVIYMMVLSGLVAVVAYQALEHVNAKQHAAAEPMTTEEL